MVVFDSLKEALRAGYHVFDHTKEHYIVRIRTEAGLAMALAKVKYEEAEVRLQSK